MPGEIVMPRLSDSMEEGTILGWMKSVGDEVAVGDELVEIETDKANMVYEADIAGTLTEIVADEGATLPIGEVIARIGEAGEAAANEQGDSESDAGDGEGPGTPSSGAAADDGESPADPPLGGTEARESESVEGEGERIKASPLARRIARDKGVDLSSLSGSGPGGRIVKADVEGAEGAPAAQAPAEAPQKAAPTPGAGEKPETARGSAEEFELTKLQQTVARRMAESKATAPHFYLTADLDMSRAVDARKRIKAAAGEGDVVPSFNDMVVKACALALAACTTRYARPLPLPTGEVRDTRALEGTPWKGCQAYLQEDHGFEAFCDGGTTANVQPTYQRDVDSAIAILQKQGSYEPLASPPDGRGGRRAAGPR